MKSTILLIGVLLGLAIIASGALAAETPVRKIKVALYLDSGAHARSQLRESLRSQNDMQAYVIGGSDIRDHCLKDVDVLVVPGGSGKKEAASLESQGKEEIRRFVQEGGLYVGICAGCYLASCAKPQYLGILPLDTIDKKHWRRGKAILPIEFTDLGMGVFGVKERFANVLYHNGPVFRANNELEGDRLRPLSYFRGEIVAPTGRSGVMIGAPAMILGRYGNGLVLGISPHPEATPGLKHVEMNAIRWLFNHRSTQNDGS